MKAEFLRLRKFAAAASARVKSVAAAAAAASGERLKEAAKAKMAKSRNLISAPISPGEERWQRWIGFCFSLAAIETGISDRSERKKQEEKLTELVNEVREMKVGIIAGLEKLSKGKETELQIMKEKENKTWFGKFLG